jgi:hypothetical protein
MKLDVADRDPVSRLGRMMSLEIKFSIKVFLVYWLLLKTDFNVRSDRPLLSSLITTFHSI